MPHDLIIIGAGAAGMMAAVTAAERGKNVLLIEKNNKVGVKILMSGGTRCNLTHDQSPRDILKPFGRKQAAFLKTAVGRFPPQAVRDWFAAAGVPTKVEETGKVFPASNRALDVQQAMLRRVREAGVKLLTGVAVESVSRVQNDPPEFEVVAGGETFSADKLLLTTGGQSYPGCGTIGEGYAWAKAFGHTIVPPVAALVPLLSNEHWLTDLSGVSLERVRCLAEPAAAAAKGGGYREFDKVAFASDQPILFTHFGLSGPGAMNVSKVFAANIGGSLRLDLAPDVSDERLRTSLSQLDPLRVLADLVPRRLAETSCDRLEIRSEKGFQLSSKNLHRLLDAVKRQSVRITGTRGFPKAEVTAGGVSLAEVDPRTMESLRMPGLYFAGEILDIDGPIGGYNFQAAFGTGRMAGELL